MIRTIIKKEILENITSYKFAVIISLSTILILTSFFIMSRNYQHRMENYEILQPKAGEPTAIIPPTPLSIFANGLDANLCRSYEIRFGGQIQVGSKQQSVNTLFQLFTTPDLLYIVKIIMSLCALIFAFDRISGEKSSGTLRMSLSNSVRRSNLIIGKWIGGFVSLIVPFLLACLTATVIVTLSPQIQLNGDDWTKLILFLFSSVLYIAIFFSLGLLISGLTHQTSSSLVISLFLWAIMIFVIPNLGNILAKQFVHLPSVQQLETKRQQIWIKEVFERIHQGKSGTEALNNINDENDRLMSDYRSRFEQVVNTARNITRLSPAAAFTFLASDLTGTGLYEERKIKNSIIQYKNLIWNKPTDSDGNLVGDFPVFSYKRSSVKEILSHESMSNILIIILFNVLFFTAAYVVFLRYDVR